MRYKTGLSQADKAGEGPHIQVGNLMSKLMKQARLLISTIDVIKVIKLSGKGSKTNVKIEIKFSN